MNEGLIRRIAEALLAQRAATAEDLLQRYRSEVTVTRDFTGYFNPRVTASVDRLSSSEVTHLKFVPMIEDGLVLLLEAAAGEEGATEFVRSDSRRTGQINLRLALAGFALDFAKDRKLKFPVETLEVPVGNEQEQARARRTVLVLKVKQPASQKVVQRPRKKKAARAGAPPAPAEQAVPATEAAPAAEPQGEKQS